MLLCILHDNEQRNGCCLSCNWVVVGGGKQGGGGKLVEGSGEEVPEEQSLEVEREQGPAEFWGLLWCYYTALDPVSKGLKGGRSQKVLAWTQQAVL